MKKTIFALVLAGMAATSVNAATEGSAIATWKATAKKDTTSNLVVTPLGSIEFAYAEGIKGFNTVNGLFDVSVKGDAQATDFTLKAKKISGKLNHLGGGSNVEVGVLWQGKPVATDTYTTLIDTSAGINGGNLSPIANGFKGDVAAQGMFSFLIDSATVGGQSASFDTLPDGLFTGEVNVEFVANWS